MLSRREALWNGLAVSAMTAFPGAVAFPAAVALPAAETASAPVFRPGAAIVDRDLPDAGRAADAFRRESAAVHVFAGDPGLLWMSAIEPALRREPQPIAGFTSAAALFCFQYLLDRYGLGLAAIAPGAARLDRLGAGEEELLDLRDPRFGNADAAWTWVLAPKRG